MFDFNKLGDVAKMAGQAKKIQAKQEEFQQKQLQELKNIGAKLDKIIQLLEK